MFSLSISALDKNIFDGQAESLTLPGIEGELTILENHIPLITPLKTGTLWFKSGKQAPGIVIKGGILRVSPEKVIVLVNL